MQFEYLVIFYSFLSLSLNGSIHSNDWHASVVNFFIIYIDYLLFHFLCFIHLILNLTESHLSFYFSLHSCYLSILFPNRFPLLYLIFLWFFFIMVTSQFKLLRAFCWVLNICHIIFERGNYFWKFLTCEDWPFLLLSYREWKFSFGSER